MAAVVLVVGEVVHTFCEHGHVCQLPRIHRGPWVVSTKNIIDDFNGTTMLVDIVLQVARYPSIAPPAFLIFNSSLSLSLVNTSITVSHSTSRGNAPILRPVSSEMVSASVVLCNTAPCFLQSHASGTKVLVPTSIKYPLLMDFESFNDPAKSASAR